MTKKTMFIGIMYLLLISLLTFTVVAENETITDPNTDNENFLVIDMNKTVNIVLIGLLLIISFVGAFYGFYLLGGGVITLIGLMLFFSDISPFLSMIITFIGVMILIQSE